MFTLDEVERREKGAPDVLNRAKISPAQGSAFWWHDWKAFLIERQKKTTEKVSVLSANVTAKVNVSPPKSAGTTKETAPEASRANIKVRLKFLLYPRNRIIN